MNLNKPHQFPYWKTRSMEKGLDIQWLPTPARDEPSPVPAAAMGNPMTGNRIRHYGLACLVVTSLLVAAMASLGRTPAMSRTEFQQTGASQQAKASWALPPAKIGQGAPPKTVLAKLPAPSPDVGMDPIQSRALQAASSLSQAFRAVSQTVLPTVVAIENRTGPMVRSYGRLAIPPKRSGTPEMAGAGSGVIVDPSGLVLTNHHVVAGDGEITVRLQDGREYVADQVWSDPKTDIAVVKITATETLPWAQLGDSDQAQVGDWVLALGQPFGLESTVTAGIVSAKGRSMGIADREDFIQTDAAINPGNSGGPLVNLQGQVIGINTAISSRSGGNNGIGFAVPVNLARWVADELIDDGVVQRAYLGIGVQQLSQTLADRFQIPPRSGLLVSHVIPDSPAAIAGLRAGDILLEFAGQAVNSPSRLQTLVERSGNGVPCDLKLLRNGQPVNIRCQTGFGQVGRP